MRLSVIIPTFNELGTIEEVINRVQQVSAQKEIIIVDDGSTDGTKKILKSFNMDNITVIYHNRNMGKGQAIRTALPVTTGDIIIIQDADLEYNPEEYLKLIEPIEKGKTEVVYGSRILDGKFKSVSFQNFIFYLGGKSLSMLTNFLYRANITDEPTCYKVFKSDILKSLNLKCKGFEFCPEVTAKILRQGIKIHEVPISCNPRTIKEGKKIRLKDWFVAIWILIKYRFKK
ncbi:MAG: glycosyltransferase family 2 protein [Candidatus Omnitrophica bacterium]|nr:glycosyltransferase family 2 protein [Candidatus Omnitrophota bacterium]MBU1047711.1 glycosyltransferase family 2 protein [Candidatus Omnitrophota bacterium]MBU1766679.1 glycosyltransferase family 2 protein [Candidatus Omnitrophota bacterium]MBU1888559.1 glycosyltransferase family 2 protein [Candidatus Omnitrophota bacterium]